MKNKWSIDRINGYTVLYNLLLAKMIDISFVLTGCQQSKVEKKASLLNSLKIKLIKLNVIFAVFKIFFNSIKPTNAHK